MQHQHIFADARDVIITCDDSSLYVYSASWCKSHSTELHYSVMFYLVSTLTSY